MLSISFSSAEVVTDNRSSTDPSEDDSSFCSRESLRRVDAEPLLMVIGKSPESCTDICLHLAANAMCLLEENLSATKGVHFKPSMPSKETFDDSSDVSATFCSSGFSSASVDCTCLLPEGKLKSLSGDVVAFHGFGGESTDAHLNCERLCALDIRHFQGNTSNLCIHVFVDNQMVMIFGSLSKHAIPVGFGPDVNATFYQILELRGTNKWRLTPVSYIVLNSVRVAAKPFSDASSRSRCKINKPSNSCLESIPSGTIYELIQHKSRKPFRFNCRVIAVHFLVLEKNVKCYDLPSEAHLGPHFVDIPLVGLVLDDGSATCCCWADAGEAAALLRLHDELPLTAIESSGCTFKWVGIEQSCWKSAIFLLERIIRKHGRVTIRNYGSTAESSNQNLLVSVHSDNALSGSDENLLKSIFFNACFGAHWTIVACVMDSDAVEKLEKDHLVQMEMTVLPMQNVWVIEVQLMNPLAESRNLIQELVNR